MRVIYHLSQSIKLEPIIGVKFTYDKQMVNSIPYWGKRN